MKNIMKVCLILLSLMSFQSFAASSATFDRIVIFGDSLSDNGNLYSKDLGLLPKSPPYYQGRFSNGPVWSEQVAKFFGDKNSVATDNYAVGGETVNWHSPWDGFLPYDLSDSIDDYYYRNLLYDKSHTLFIIWMGGNDYINGDQLDPEPDSTAVVATLEDKINYLISLGGQSFLIVNLPDMGASPSALGKDGNTQRLLTQTTDLHNAKLAAAVARIAKNNPNVNIHLKDIHAFAAEMHADIAAFNLKYHTRITNTTEACWTGGKTLKQMQVGDVAGLLARDYGMNHAVQKGMDFQGFARSIMKNEDLGAAYSVAQAAADDLKPCADPDAYAFWDGVHSTETLHKVVASVMLDTINQYYQVG